MDAKLTDQLNKFITKKLYASNFYLSAASYFRDNNLPGFTGWMTNQAAEEINHTTKIIKYIESRDGQVVLNSVKKPPFKFRSIRDVLIKVLVYEKKTGEAINDLYTTARDLRDSMATFFIEWFVHQQVEEERLIVDIISKMDLMKDDSDALKTMDDEMAKMSDLSYKYEGILSS